LQKYISGAVKIIYSPVFVYYIYIVELVNNIYSLCLVFFGIIGRFRFKHLEYLGGGFNTRLIEKTSATTNALVLNGWLSNIIHYTGELQTKVSSDSGAIQIPSLPQRSPDLLDTSEYCEDYCVQTD